MIRAFAIGLGIATQRVLFVIPRIVLIGHRTPTRDEIEMLMLGAFAAAFVLHAAVAEAWIRSGRSRRPTVTAAPSYAPSTAPT
jgi:Ca2+/H+ antiporter